MNHKYSAKLKIDVKLFDNDLHPIEFLKSLIILNSNEKVHYHYRLPKEHISNELMRFFAKHRQYIDFIEIFYIPPHESIDIHIDGDMFGSFGKLNWVFGGANSKMIWYTILDPVCQGDTNKTDISSTALVYQPSQVEFSYSENLQGPNLVEVGIPHTVRNSVEARWCVSVIFVNSHTKNYYHRPTLEESLEIFKDYIVGDPERI